MHRWYRGRQQKESYGGLFNSQFLQMIFRWRACWIEEEAIRAKNMFLAIMSHEIRTPLNGLLGMSEALAASDLTPDQRELVNAMLSSGVIIADILGDILDLASVESGIQLFTPFVTPLVILALEMASSIL
jgi:signal transduction histidine kinase